MLSLVNGSRFHPTPALSQSDPGELREEVDDGVEHRRVEHVRGGLVIPGRDLLVEVAVVVHRGNATARPDLSRNGPA